MDNKENNFEKEWIGCVKNFYKAFSLSDDVQVSLVSPKTGMVTFCKDWKKLNEEYEQTPLSRIGSGMKAEAVPETFSEFEQRTNDAYSMILHYEGKISLFKKRDQDLEAVFDSYEEYHAFFDKICQD